jgi:DNA repair protein RAD50
MLCCCCSFRCMLSSSKGADKHLPMRSLDDVKQMKDDAQNELEQLDKNLQCKHRTFRIQQDCLQELRESLTELKNERLKLTSDIQKKERLNEQLQKLTHHTRNLNDDIDRDRQALEPIVVSRE